MTDGTRRKQWKRWLIAGIAVAVLGAVGGPYVYIHFVQGPAPAPLTLDSPSVAASAAGGSTSDQGSSSDSGSAGIDGTWKVTTGSVVGYRVKEVLFGQSNVAVGRTGQVTGSMVVSDTTVDSAIFTVDMTTVQSDESRRDGQFNGRIMETSTFPTATFKLNKAIDLGSIPSAGSQRTFQATGELILHGVTKTVTFNLTGRYTGSTTQVAGTIPITFADWNISNPSFGPVTTEDHGLLEFRLNFSRG